MNLRIHLLFSMLAPAMTGLCLTLDAAADPEAAGQGIELGAPFGNHAVLQREMPLADLAAMTPDRPGPTHLNSLSRKKGAKIRFESLIQWREAFADGNLPQP